MESSSPWADSPPKVSPTGGLDDSSIWGSTAPAVPIPATTTTLTSSVPLSSSIPTPIPSGDDDDDEPVVTASIKGSAFAMDEDEDEDEDDLDDFGLTKEKAVVKGKEEEEVQAKEETGIEDQDNELDGMADISLGDETIETETKEEQKAEHEGEEEEIKASTPKEVEAPIQQQPPPATTMTFPGPDPEQDEENDEFGFSEPISGNPAVVGGDEDDDFGDFGDFDDAGGFEDAAEGLAIEEEGQVDGFGTGDDGAGQVEERGFVAEPEEFREAVTSLALSPLPSTQSLSQQIQALLSDLYPNPPVESGLITDEAIRETGGLGQLLTTESSRDIYAQLTTQPTLKPLDWTRSRVRREHLISLGVPVNLDEVDSHRLNPLPPLKITTIPPSPTSSRSNPNQIKRSTFPGTGTNGSTNGKRDSSSSNRSPLHSNATAGPSRTRASLERKSKSRDESDLGERPAWDKARAERLLDYREDQLSLVPPKYLSRMQDDLVQACSDASRQLAWLKQIEEIRKDDSKKSNEKIAELITKAQMLKASETSSSSGGIFRKSSQRHSVIGTPQRVASPAGR